MFERFTDPVTVVRVVQKDDRLRLRRLIAGGARVDRRTPYQPWMNPLDAATSTGNAAVAKLLLDAGAPIYGSSIHDAIACDASACLKVMHAKDNNFCRFFTQESGHQTNPRLNRWTLLFSALDFAVSMHARECEAFLREIGTAAKEAKPHRSNCAAIHIEEESFLSFRGVNRDGLTEVTEGFYCAKCHAFTR